MIVLKDWWQAEPVDVEGSWILADAGIYLSSPAHALARLLVIHAISYAVGERRRPVLDGIVAASYLGALIAADDAERGTLSACLAAAEKRDTRALADALYEAARVCAHVAPHAARSMAELGYEAALETGAWQAAYCAARLLEWLAILDECPPAAERWASRAQLQLGRVQRGLSAL